MFDNAKIFITGGTGSWGQCLTTYLLKTNVKEIIIYSRNELSHVTMKEKFNDERLTFIIGDVRNVERLIEASKEVDYIFHLAALKHVPICEEQPYEAILTNIIGTVNVIKAAITNKVKKVINVSSDKAVSPNNLYGLTKAIGEKLIIEANNKKSQTKFICVRAGNVIGSNGSVIPLFINQIKKNNLITITDINMTRFFITLDEAIKLLIKASQFSYGGEILIMKMTSMKINDLAQILIKYYGNEKTVVNYSKIRLGEKINEELVSVNEARNTYQLDDDYYLIITPMMYDKLKPKYANLKKVTFNSYNSSTDLLSIKQIKQRLRQANFIDGR